MGRRYKVAITKQVEKFIRKQDKSTQIRIVKAVNELPDGAVKKLRGYSLY